MKIDIRHAPSFAVARVALDAGEAVRAESGAMMAMSPGITVTASADGGLVKGVKRSLLGGESLFVSRFAAEDGAGWIDLAPRLPGDVTVIEVRRSVELTRGCWVASSDALRLDTRWAGFKNLAGGEGGFLTRVTNEGSSPGLVLVSCFGALDVLDLADGERVVVDTGHLVAFDAGVRYEMRDVSAGLVQSLKSGESLVFDVTGPGRVWTQTRNPKQLVGWLASRGLKRS
ncbi:AIM24 family protein [Jatrophihabitans fulvus]